MKLEAVPVALYRHPAWLAWKETQGWRKMETALGFSLLCRAVGESGSMAYVAGPHTLPGALRGTIIERGSALEDLSLRVQSSLPRDCIFIRWDLMTSAWTDDGGRPLAPHLLELRMNASTARRRLRKSATEHTCPDTMVVDLEGGESAIRGRLDERTRYSVRLAERRDTAVERVGESGIGEFYALYKETSARQGLVLHPESAFRDLFRLAREYGLEVDLYLATAKGESAAGAIFARIRDEAWYLFAASSAANRAAAGPTAILYRAMIDCAASGIRRMDLLGVGPAGSDDHPLSGLTLFKKGFGGRRLTRAGAWDYVLDPDTYAQYAQMECLA